MNKQEILQTVVERFESGEYVQHKGCLRIVAPGPKCMCFLGAVCDVVDPAGWRQVDNLYTHGGRVGMPGLAPRVALGVSYGEVSNITDANDSGGLSPRAIVNKFFPDVQLKEAV